MPPGATFWSVEKPTLTPPEPPSRIELAHREARPGSAAGCVRVTLTHSPATTCMTSGSGLLVRALIAAASLVGTYAVRPPLELSPDRSMARQVEGARRRAGGHGLPGPSEAGGAWPVGVGVMYGVRRRRRRPSSGCRSSTQSRAGPA